jgi:uncharacterized protein
MGWEYKPIGRNPKMKRAVFIEGLPGIGNVGKVAVDFLVSKLKADKICEISSYSMPHSVFVTENDLIEMPSIEIYHVKHGATDFLFLTGDVQPIDEFSCWEFCDQLLDYLQQFGVKEIVTTGGIGLQEIGKVPKVYVTGNGKEIVKRYVDGTQASSKIYGVVGPIVGVTGLLLGLAARRKIPAVALLAETIGHPMYLGIKGAREILKLLDIKYNYKIDLKDLDKEIKEIEGEVMKRTKDLSQVSKDAAIRKIEGKFGKDMNYIG